MGELIQYSPIAATVVFALATYGGAFAPQSREAIATGTLGSVPVWPLRCRHCPRSSSTDRLARPWCWSIRTRS